MVDPQRVQTPELAHAQEHKHQVAEHIIQRDQAITALHLTTHYVPLLLCRPSLNSFEAIILILLGVNCSGQCQNFLSTAAEEHSELRGAV